MLRTISVSQSGNAVSGKITVTRSAIDAIKKR